MTRVRRAATLDAREIAELLNEIIVIGGTTARTRPVSAGEIRAQMASDPAAIWHVCETDAGELLGVQWVERHPELEDGAVDIATFVRVGHTEHGIGSALFRATECAARAAGFRWINATIRADNTGGLVYYQSRGFERYGVLANRTLENGLVVDQILKRYDLD